MPKLDIGSKADYEQGGNRFVQLKAKDQLIHVRIIDSPAYDGKHFVKDGDKWDILYCDRIMKGDICVMCEKYFELARKLKEVKERIKKDMQQEGDEALKKRFEAEVRKVKPTITFYYPVIDRSSGEAKILKVTTMVRLKIDEEKNNGIDPLKYDYIIKRTEVTGSYYTLTRLDSAETKPLSEKELEQVELAKTWDIEELSQGKVSKQLNHDEEEEDDEKTKQIKEKVEDFDNQKGETVAVPDPDQVKMSKGKKKVEESEDDDLNPDDVPF